MKFWVWRFLKNLASYFGLDPQICRLHARVAFGPLAILTLAGSIPDCAKVSALTNHDKKCHIRANDRTKLVLNPLFYSQSPNKSLHVRTFARGALPVQR